jgi:hypothetical protein
MISEYILSIKECRKYMSAYFNNDTCFKNSELKAQAVSKRVKGCGHRLFQSTSDSIHIEQLRNINNELFRAVCTTHT